MLPACPSNEWSIYLGNGRYTFASVPTANCWPGWIRNDSVCLWDLASGREIPFLGPPLSSGWHSLAFYPDSDHLTFGTASGMVETWDTRTARRVSTLGRRREGSLPARTAGGWRARDLTVWSSKTGSRVFSLPQESGPIWSLALSPDGERLAVGSADGGLAIWNLPKIQAQLAQIGLAWRADAQPAAAAGAAAFCARDAPGAAAPDQRTT